MKFDRRTALKGMLGGGAVSVALPYLDCFLNTNGTALAATGAPLPIRFGTWFWGCGLTPGRWIPQKIGAGYDMGPELKPLDAFKDRLSIFSGFKANTDGKGAVPHYTGSMSIMTGAPPKGQGMVEAPTFDTMVADTIGGQSRFRSLEVTATGNPSDSNSRRSSAVINASEPSPLAFYTRIFGPEFKDPNAADFKPDPKVMVRKSALSAIKDQRDALLSEVGVADRVRLDEYFTSIRQLEQQLDIQLQKPAPLEACKVPGQPGATKVGTQIEDVIANHKLMAGLMAQALACNQTQVFNVMFGDATSSLRKAGNTTTHHQLTHEEPIDEKSGVQPEATYFVERIVEGLQTMLVAMDSVREGDGTLLDHMLLLAYSECSFAKVHSLESIPMIVAGRANGKIRSGLHIDGNGDPVTRVGLTIQQVLGVPVSSWGAGSMQTSKSVTEIMV
ncbi:MAG TPA: DUF1552 domain-containing protein [Alphaproteobacteria bacterium]|jgi:hypothetical protein|nr:DUF1552 domain-containing protein [Alphaproteobacteria bacterium]